MLGFSNLNQFWKECGRHQTQRSFQLLPTLYNAHTWQDGQHVGPRFPLNCKWGTFRCERQTLALLDECWTWYCKQLLWHKKKTNTGHIFCFSLPGGVFNKSSSWASFTDPLALLALPEPSARRALHGGWQEPTLPFATTWHLPLLFFRTTRVMSQNVQGVSPLRSFLSGQRWQISYFN